MIVPHPKRRRAEQVLNAARVRAALVRRARRRRDPRPRPASAWPTTRCSPPAGRRGAGGGGGAAGRPRAARRGGRAAAPASRPPAAAGGGDAGAGAGAAAGPCGAAGSRSPGDFVQFRVAVGRRDKADPKWLVPLICRLGQVTKREIGAIRVFDTDTRFEITRAASAAFAAATAGSTPGEPRITPAGDGPMAARERPVHGPNAGHAKPRAATARLTWVITGPFARRQTAARVRDGACRPPNCHGSHAMQTRLIRHMPAMQTGEPMKRRSFLSASPGLAAGTGCAVLSLAQNRRCCASSRRPICRAWMRSPARSTSSATPAMMVWDTLYGVTSKLEPRPQMAEGSRGAE